MEGTGAVACRCISSAECTEMILWAPRFLHQTFSDMRQDLKETIINRNELHTHNAQVLRTNTKNPMMPRAPLGACPATRRLTPHTPALQP